MPSVQQASIGVDRPIGEFLTLQMSYQWQRGHDQLRSLNINAPDEFGVRPDPTAGTITQIESTGRMANDRVTLNANFRVPQHNIFFNVGYTLAQREEPRKQRDLASGEQPGSGGGVGTCVAGHPASRILLL